MSTHATLSPSGRFRWAACPGSVRELAKYPEGKGSAAAIDGTHSHTLLEHCLKRPGGIADPKVFLGMVLTDHEGMFAVEQERVERVRVATDYILKRQEQMPNCFIVSEQRVNPEPLVGRTDMSGTVDVQIHHMDFLEVIDYKDGMNPVEAAGNQQLEQYAVGVLAGIYKRTGTKPYKRVRLTIIQPKAAIKGGEPITHAEYDAEELLNRVTMALVMEGAATDDPEAPLVPGEKQCTYCAHKGACTAFNKWLLDKSGVKFDDMTKSAAEQSGDTMTDDQLRQVIEAAPLLRKMIEAAEIEATRRISSGHPVPGLKLVRGRGTRSWMYDEEETAKKLTRMGIPKGEVYRQVILSPAQAEKLKWTKRDGTEQCLTQKQIEKLNQEYVKVSDGRMTVAPESDRRASIEFGDLSKMFSAVQQDAPKAEAAEIPAWLS